jgi:CBS domain-containing protein
MLARDIMTSPVITIQPSASISEAADLMLKHHISGLPVALADGTLVGMITEGDFLRRGELGTEQKRSRWLEFFLSPGKAADEYVRSHGRKIEEIMSTSVVCTRPDAPLDEVITQMIDRNIKRLPVILDNKIAGIVCRSDLLRALARQLPVDAVARNDDELQDAIVTELRRSSWSGNANIQVEVKSGVATLSGVIFDERERLAARVAAENVPGVKAVTDELTWVDPMSGMTMPPPSTAGGL